MAEGNCCLPIHPGGQCLQGRILSVGHNFLLLRERNAAIQNAGYQVVTTRESDLVGELAEQKKFDAIVLCSSIPAHLRRTMALELRRLKALPPLIVLCLPDERDCFDDLADQVLTMPRSGSHQPLINAIAQVTRTSIKE